MRQTLFIIPQNWFEGPLLFAWVVGSILWVSYIIISKSRSLAKTEVLTQLPFLLIGAVVIGWVLPQLSVYGVNPDDPNGDLIKIGLAVRGYGVFLLLAIVSGVGITIYRGNQIDISADKVISLAFWMIISGLIGARLFYLIQKRDDFFADGTLQQQIFRAIDPTQGGLVVFGSLFGGSLAAFLYLKVKGMPVLKTLDLIAPGMALGLAIGRIGCLMNGCCYGGISEIDRLPTLQFPAGSAPYMQQLIDGQLIGLKTVANPDGKSDPNQFRSQVIAVEKGSLGEELGIATGDLVTLIPPDDLRIRFFLTDTRASSAAEEVLVFLASNRQGWVEFPLSQLPRESLKTHPTQVYSSIDAFLLSLFLWFFWRIRQNEGEVFGLMLLLHGVSRFLLEIVRQDEQGIWGTSFTISQWISLLLVFGGIVWLGIVRGNGSVKIPKYPTRK